MDKNAVALLREAYTRNMRRSFAAQVLGVLEPGDAANLQKLLGKD